MQKPPPLDYNSQEIEKRRDEVVRRMANTPPQPKLNIPSKKKTKADENCAVRKSPVVRED